MVFVTRDQARNMILRQGTYAHKFQENKAVPKEEVGGGRRRWIMCVGRKRGSLGPPDDPQNSGIFLLETPQGRIGFLSA